MSFVGEVGGYFGLFLGLSFWGIFEAGKKLVGSMGRPIV